MKYIFIIALLLIVFVVVVYFYTQTKIQETFGDPITIKKTHDILDLNNQFDDIIEYNNDQNGRIGLDKCIEGCNGYCVEFGLTGDAHCFPIQDDTTKDFYGLIVQNDRKLSFPNIDRTNE